MSPDAAPNPRLGRSRPETDMRGNSSKRTTPLRRPPMKTSRPSPPSRTVVQRWTARSPASVCRTAPRRRASHGTGRTAIRTSPRASVASSAEAESAVSDPDAPEAAISMLGPTAMATAPPNTDPDDSSTPLPAFTRCWT